MATQRKKRRGLPTISVKAVKLARAEARVQHWLDVLHAVLDGYENDQPHWRGLVLAWLMESSVDYLCRYVEKGKDSGARWRQPFVEVRYAVNWNWDYKGPGDPIINYGTISSATSDSGMKKIVMAIAVETVVQTTLQDVTHRVAIEKHGKKHEPLLPVEVIEVLRKVRGRRRRQAILDDLYQPFSMGAAEVEIDEATLKDGRPLSKKTRSALAKAHRRIDLPPVFVTVTKDDRKLTLTPIFQIHPLVVEVPNRQAYYPMTFGIMLAPQPQPGEDIVELFKAPWARPELWPASERKLFWKKLAELFREVGKSLKLTAAPAAEEAVLTVSAKIRVKLDPSRPEQSEDAVNQMLSNFQKTGAVLEMNHAWTKQLAQASVNFGELLRHVEASGVREKGTALEKLVSVLFASVPGFTVKSNSRTQTEEIDLVVVNGHDDPRWKTGSPLILVECKNRSDACGKNDIVQFRAKLENRRGTCRLGFIVSMNGFADTAYEELQRGSKGDLTIAAIDGEMVRAAVSTGCFIPILQQAWDRAVIA